MLEARSRGITKTSVVDKIRDMHKTMVARPGLQEEMMAGEIIQGM